LPSGKEPIRGLAIFSRQRRDQLARVAPDAATEADV
jgi:hypothetical protein